MPKSGLRWMAIALPRRSGLVRRKSQARGNDFSSARRQREKIAVCSLLNQSLAGGLSTFWHIFGKLAGRGGLATGWEPSPHYPNAAQIAAPIDPTLGSNTTRTGTSCNSELTRPLSKYAFKKRSSRCISGRIFAAMPPAT